MHGCYWTQAASGAAGRANVRLWTNSIDPRSDFFKISLSIFTGNFDIMWLWLTEKCEAFDGLGVDIVAFLTALFLGEYPQRSLSRVAN